MLLCNLATLLYWNLIFILLVLRQLFFCMVIILRTNSLESFDITGSLQKVPAQKEEDDYDNR